MIKESKHTSTKRQQMTKELAREEAKNNGNKYEIVTNMVDIKSMISIIILNTNGINTPIKRQRLSQRIDK